MTAVAVAVVVLTLAAVVRPRRPRPLSVQAARGLRAGPVARWLAPRLRAADVGLAPERCAAGWIAGVVATVLMALLGGGPVLAVLGLVVATVAPAMALASASGRRDLRLERELPQLLEAVARSLRSGAAIPAALREASTDSSVAATELAEVVVEADRGLTLAEALERWAGRRPLAGVRLVVGVLTVAVTSGGTPARAVDGVASTLRERAEVDRELRALATQARTSAVVVTLAPVAFAGLGVLGDERTATFLLRTPSGLACLSVGLALDGFGAWWMTRIAASAS